MKNEPEAHVSSPLQQRAEKDPQFAEDMWRFRHPEEDGEKLSLEAVLVELDVRYGMQFSLDTVSRFYRWLKVRRDARQRREDISQLKQEMAKDPNIAPEKIESFGRVMFLTDGVVDKNAKVFNTAYKLGQTDKTLAQNDKRLKQTDKSLEMEARRVSVLEKKAAFYDAVKEKAKDAGSGGVTAEQMEDIERRLKMM